MERVTIDINNHIALVTLNRPDKMNALTAELMHDIIDAAEKIAKDASVRVVVLTGNGKGFCAGLDLSNFQKGNDLLKDIVTRTHGITNIGQQIVWGWRTNPVPVIAAVHGVALGTGLQLMLGADIKYIHPNTKLSIMESKWGLIPDFAGPQLMRHTVRDDIIRELTYTSRIFSGAEAVQYGFATHLSENPLEEAMALAKEIASKSPSAIVKAKKLLNDSLHLNQEDGLMAESVAQDALLNTKNQIEAVMSGMQKRPANFDNFREE